MNTHAASRFRIVSTILLTLCTLLSTALVTPGARAGDPCQGQGNATLALPGGDPSIGTPFQLVLTGRPLARYSVLADTGPGPRTIPSVGTVCLDLGPDLRFLVDGIRQGSPRLGADGTATLDLKAPNRPSLVGRTFYVQGAIADSTAPNGIAISNMISLTVQPALVENFRTTERKDESTTNAVWNGDGVVTGTVSTTPRVSQFVPQPRSPFLLPHPLVSVNDPLTVGCRFQMKFAPEDVGAGIGESILAMSWSPRSDFVFASTYADMKVRLGHFDDRLGASLLGTFDLNYDGRRVGDPATVFQGDYSLPNAQNQVWVPWPSFQGPFEYDNAQSLVFEIDFPMGGQTFQLFRNRSPTVLPANRIFADGGAATKINVGDNTHYDTQFLLVQDRAHAQTTWQDTGLGSPDYRTPIVVVGQEPAGTSVQVQYEGATSPSDTSSYTGFQSDIDRLDGLRYIRFRVVLRGDAQSGAVPVVRKVLIPYR